MGKPFADGPDERRGRGGARPNSGPKPLASKTFKILLAERGELALIEINDMLSNPETPPNVRADLLKMLVYYAAGKPTEHVKTDATVELNDTRKASTADLGAAVGGLKMAS